MSGWTIGGTTAAVLGEVLQFTEARHEVLAGNIANISTPGYRTRDLSVASFQEALRAALASQSSYQKQPIEQVWPSALEGEAEAVDPDVRTLLFHDGSDVGIEQQVTQIVKNRMMHQLASTLLRNQFRVLEMAIAERVDV